MKEGYVQRKERWAQKMSGKDRPSRPNAGRLPAGQHEVNNFPVLDLGVHPEIPIDKWSLKIHRRSRKPADAWLGTIHGSAAVPRRERLSLCHDRGSQFDMEFEGVSFFTLAELVKPRPSATHLFFIGYDEYITNTPLDACMDDDVMIAHSWNGAPLTLEHGGPARMIIPKLYAWKGAKFIREIIFRDHDELGFWEQRGYSNTADPFHGRPLLLSLAKRIRRAQERAAREEPWHRFRQPRCPAGSGNCPGPWPPDCRLAPCNTRCHSAD